MKIDKYYHLYSDGKNIHCDEFFPEREKVEFALYDVEEIHENCTVQIWKNSVTGEESVGWWENKE